MLLWLAAPSAFFLFVNVIGALGMSQVHRKFALSVYGGQNGAAVVLVSALAALAIAIGRVAEMRRETGRFFLGFQGNHTALILVIGFLIPWLFGRFYVREYGWLYTSGGSGFSRRPWYWSSSQRP